MHRRPKETERKILYEGRIFEVARCTLQRPGGNGGTQDLVVHGGAAVFVPITKPGSLLLVRQYRHAASQALWEIPAGRLEPGEKPLAAAKRELAEECGLKAKTWKRILSFFPAPGYATEVMHLFFALNLSADTSGALPDADEDLEVKEFTHEQLRDLIRRRRILDGKTLVAALYLGAFEV